MMRLVLQVGVKNLSNVSFSDDDFHDYFLYIKFLNGFDIHEATSLGGDENMTE